MDKFELNIVEINLGKGHKSNGLHFVLSVPS